MRQSSPKREGRYLVVVADDLGRSSLVNRAVARAFDRGFVTAASVMAAGDSFEEAVTLALLRPSLSVGVHITLCDGRAILPHSHIPGLVGEDGLFEHSPFRAGLRYWRRRSDLKLQIEKEVEAQFERVREAGIVSTHVDGHHHLHMHPVIFEIVCRAAAERQVAWIRVPREPVAMSVRRGLRHVVPSLAEWVTFRMLAARNLKIADHYGLKTACRVVGLSRQVATAGRNRKESEDFARKADEEYFCALLPLLKGATNEVYAHPDLATEAGRRETETLESPAIREGVALFGISCTGYRQLLGALTPRGPKEMNG